MKTFFLTLLLAVSVASCDSQRTTTSSAATNEPTASPTDAQLAGGISIDELDAQHPNSAKAYFAGGCFWCTEASFTRIQGVNDVVSGYAGGELENPTYEDSNSASSGHAESIVVYYDSTKISYDKLLDIFFVAHDPTQLNRQGPDVGPQYRSAIFPLNEEQRQQAEAKIAQLNASGKYSKEIATTIEDPIRFWVAEPYHQNYYEDPSNPNQSYVQNVSRPKVEKVVATFKDILKPEYVQ